MLAALIYETNIFGTKSLSLSFQISSKNQNSSTEYIISNSETKLLIVEIVNLRKSRDLTIDLT